MKIFKQLFLVLLFLTGLSNAYSQENGNTGIISFFELEHDFGEIEEKNGPVTHEFLFINTGNADLAISRVAASCGCTTPGWSRETIHPGDTGYVQAQFNPVNRPGSFKKSLTVNSTSEKNQTVVLWISGKVKPRPRTPKDDFPIKIGGLRFKSRSINMGKVLNNASVYRTLELFNDSEDTIVFSDNILSPEHIQVDISKDSIAPGIKSFITVTFDPGVKNELGHSNEQIVLFTNEENQSQKKLSVIATTEEYFPPMTAEERELAPKLVIRQSDYDFGTIKQGERAEARYELTNTGKKDLNIRKTVATCGCTVVELEKDTLSPGESMTLKVVFDSTGRKGYQYKSISLFTNDPSGPTKVITIKGKVSD